MAKKSVNAVKTIVLRARNVVEKKNILNEMKSTYMTLQEVRFFSVYLSKINPRDIETRVVKFPLSDFTALLGIKKVNLSSMTETTDKLLGKVINIPDGNGGYVGFQLFKRCKVYKNDDENWCVEIDAHDDALPLLFDFKDNYFKYMVGNILRLSSINQQRMYEILKQYEHVGFRVVKIKELRDLIGIKDNEYSAFKDFRVRVLNSCQKALKENTDICFDYELIKKGRGGKVTEIRFLISKNQGYVEMTTLEDFVEAQKKCNDYTDTTALIESINSEELNENSWYSRISFFSEALNNEFTREQVEVLFKLAIPVVDCKRHRYGFDTSMYDYLSFKLAEVNAKRNVKHKYNYLKRLIEIDVEDNE